MQKKTSWLYTFPQKGWKHVHNLYAALKRPSKTRNRPIHIQIEPTTLCNLACAQCPRDFYVKKAQNMVLAKFMEIIDDIQPYYLTFNGLGEPTLNKEFFKMIEYAKSKGVSVNTTSNAVRMPPDHIEGFLKSGVDLINISVDAAKPETYIKTRSEDSFKAVISNLHHLIDTRNQRGLKTPSIRLCFVIQKENLSEMVDFFYLGKNLKADSILYQIFESFVEDKKYLINGINPDEISGALDKIIALESSNCGLSTNARYLKNKINDVKKLYANESITQFRRCVMPWISLYASVEGDVRPCCRFSGKRYNMGNLFESKIADIYKNKKYFNFRDKIKKGDAPDSLCATCIPDSPFDFIDRARWTPNFLMKVR